MAYTFDDSRATGTMGIPAAAMRKYYDWRRHIRDGGVHPSVAADNVGDMNYKELGGTHGQYEVRLNGKHRATFTIDGTRVVVHQIGGHT